ncbi:helix-turn-helix domain-containing protein [Streptomyces sp. PanSC19]|uniref:helix-turn-helix domain-containing protein n=1 Tax=Streptomyces sp. PanSC19 TaxID=1520455 RepID=UPI0037DA6616
MTPTGLDHGEDLRCGGGVQASPHTGVFASHCDARLTVPGRRILVKPVLSGRPVAHVAAEMGTSRPTAHEWVRRRRTEGDGHPPVSRVDNASGRCARPGLGGRLPGERPRRTPGRAGPGEITTSGECRPARGGSPGREGLGRRSWARWPLRPTALPKRKKIRHGTPANRAPDRTGRPHGAQGPHLRDAGHGRRRSRLEAGLLRPHRPGPAGDRTG